MSGVSLKDLCVLQAVFFAETLRLFVP